MRPFFALVRKDLKGYFDQPTGYILVVIFVVLLSYLFFNAAFLSGEASLRPLFTTDFSPSLPWLLAIFVPAATMRLLAEEHRDGTLEFLMTQPVRGWTVLTAKFTSGLVFVGAAIVATITIPLTLQTAGDLDEGAIIAQYLGSIFLTASLISIGLFTSSLTRNQIVSFMAALALNFMLMFAGLDLVRAALPVQVAVLFQDLSPVTHFSSMARGVLDLRDVLYFIALILTFLSAAYLMLRSRSLSRRSPQFVYLQFGVAGMVVLSLLIGWFGNSIGGRLDLTEDKIYTLSGGMEQIVDELDDVLTIKLFESKDLPPQHALVARDVNDFLDGLASTSDDVEVVRRRPDPAEEGDEDTIEAQMLGVPQVQSTLQSQSELQLKNIYLGVSMTYADRKEIIPFVEQIDGLEYRVASLANQMLRRELKTIGFLSGHDEMTLDVHLPTLAGVLSTNYNVIQVEAAEDQDLDLSALDVLVVARPISPFPQQHIDALRDYIDQGGKVAFLLDPILVFPDPQGTALLGGQNTASLASFVNRYGVFVDQDLLLDYRSYSNFPGSALPYPYWMRVPVIDDKIAGNVETTVLAWASSVGITQSEVGPVEVIPLLETTAFAARLELPDEQSVFNVSPDIIPEVSETDLREQLTGVAVTGTAPAGQINGESSSFRLVVIGDSDWISDAVVNQPDGADNLFLFSNLIDWLAQEDALADIRSKLITSRQLLFDSQTHRNLVQYGNVVGIPFFFALLGVIRFLMRRRATRRVYGSAR